MPQTNTLCTDFTGVTLNIPNGFYVRNIRSMAWAAMNYPGLAIKQGAVSMLLVSGDPHTEEFEIVSEWAAFNLPLR